MIRIDIRNYFRKLAGLSIFARKWCSELCINSNYRHRDGVPGLSLPTQKHFSKYLPELLADTQIDEEVD